MAKKRGAGLTADEERFVEEYLIDRNGTAAYVRTYPDAKRTTAAVESHRLLKKPKIAEAVRLGCADLSRRTKVKADKVIREYGRLAFYDIGAAFDLTRDEPVLLPPRLIPFEVRQAIIAVKVKRRKVRSKSSSDVIEEVEEWEYKFADKVAALDKLSRHLGLYQDLPPLELILGFLPRDIADEVRRRLAQAVSGEQSAAIDEPHPQQVEGRSDTSDEGGRAHPGPVADEADQTPGPSDQGAVHPPLGEDPDGGVSGDGPLLD